MPNPITEIRFFDYKFYLDSDMFLDINDNFTKEFRCMADIYDHKIAGSVHFDQHKKCFVIKMHEKDTEEERNFSNGTKFQYCIDWLKSMGNTKATNIIEILTKLKQSTEDHLKKIPQYASKYSEIMSKTDSPIFFIKSIDEKTKKYILEQPYISRTFMIDLYNPKGNPGIIAEEYSMDFVKMMGYQESDMAEILFNFLRLNIQKSSYVANVYNHILAFSQRLMNKFDTKADPTKTDCFVFSEKVIIKDKYGSDAYERGISIYEERWFENRSLFIKSYSIPWEIKFYKKFYF